MTPEEMQTRITDLAAHRNRWRNRAFRIVDAIREKDPSWADRILDGWERDGERTGLSEGKRHG